MCRQSRYQGIGLHFKAWITTEYIGIPILLLTMTLLCIVIVRYDICLIICVPGTYM